MSWCYRAALLVIAMTASGCVYYNTFFLANKAYDEAEEMRIRANQEVAVGGAAQKYDEAIKKASKVLQNHPKSKYADDALMMIGKSFYYTGQYSRGREKFIELTGVFRDSKLVPEARFYMGMCEYYLGNADKAEVMLRDMAENGKDKSLRRRALFMLARIPFEEEEYVEALPRLNEYVAQYSGSELRVRADSMIAACYWETKQYDSARVAYKELSKHGDDLDFKFAALYRYSESAYHLDQFELGIKEFRGLSKDDRWYQQKGILEYQIAMGLWSVDSVAEALEIFRRIPEDHQRTEAAARSLFAMGEIYQVETDSLLEAQSYFKEIAKVWTADREFAAAAVERSREIGQLLALQGDLSTSDSSQFAESHFLLGELYLRQLENPDSALEEFRLVVDDFSESDYAPVAMLNLAEVVMARDADTALAHEIWGVLVERYPGGEAAIWARRKLGLPPPEDIAQSDILLIYGAENMLLEADNPDSALKLYELLIRKFPESKHLPRAEFARAWIIDNHFPREDSTVYLAYQHVVSTYPNTEYAQAASRRLNPQARNARTIGTAQVATPTDTLYTDTAALKTTIAELSDTIRTAPIPLEEGTFEYVPIPDWNWPSALTVTFKIHINDQGEVDNDLELIGGSGFQEVDEKAKIAMLQTRFDPVKLDAFLTLTREWYKYEFLIPPPGQSKAQWQRELNQTTQDDLFGDDPFNQ
jgi:TolA-binding protein